MTCLPSRLAGDDRGMTLIELLMYSALLMIVLPLAGLVVHSATSTERDVRAVTDAGTTAQMLTTSLGSGVRNATSVSTPSAIAPHEHLVVSTRAMVAGVATPTCRAWFYDGAAEALYTKQVPIDAHAREAVAAPVIRPVGTPARVDSIALESWSLLAEGVTPRPDDPTALTPGTRPLFTATPAPTSVTVTVDLRIPTSPRAPGEPVTSRDAVAISTAFTTRTPDEIGTSLCY